MNEKLVIYQAWVLFGSIGLVLIMLLILYIYNYMFIKNNSRELSERIGEFKHEVRQFQKPYDNQQAEQISLMV